MPRRAMTRDPVHLVLAMEHGYPQRFAAGSLPWRYLTAPGAPWSGTCTALTGRRARSSPCFGAEEIVMPLRESRATYGRKSGVADLAVHRSEAEGRVGAAIGLPPAPGMLARTRHAPCGQVPILRRPGIRSRTGLPGRLLLGVSGGTAQHRSDSRNAPAPGRPGRRQPSSIRSALPSCRWHSGQGVSNPHRDFLKGT